MNNMYFPFYPIIPEHQVFTSFLHPEYDGLTDGIYKQINGVAHAYLFLWWTATTRREKYKYWFDILNKYEKITTTVLCNTQEDCNILSEIGFEILLIPHNVFLSEYLFYPYTNREYKYKAVYNSQILPYKRIELALLLNNWRLISYVNENVSLDVEYRSKILLRVGQNTFVNPTRILSPNEINAIYNQSKCGLILSKEEGGSYVTVEYLLSGLPVISTKSIGGRDLFLDTSNSIIVNDNPQSVLEAVNSIGLFSFNPEKIRNDVLKKIEKYRNDFYRHLLFTFNIQNIDYKRFEQNKLLTWTDRILFK